MRERFSDFSRIPVSFRENRSAGLLAEPTALLGRKTEMTKTNDSIERPVFENVLIERQDAASRFIGAQATSAKWMVLPGSRPVRLAELRNSMCRWPIGDPQLYDAFRFCGAACHLGDSYCVAHKKMAFAPSKPQRKLPEGTISPARLQIKG
jgi:hypothetical protein